MGLWAGLRQRGMERVSRWARRRHGSEPGAVTITRRRVYILPTGLGIAYAAMLFAMLLAGLNYGNNLALVLTFLLAAASWVAMHQCHYNLVGLQLTPAGSHPPFAGGPAGFSFQLSTAPPREDLVVSSGPLSRTTLSLAAGGSALATVTVPTSRRGRVRLARLRIESTFPLGLFTAWTWVYPERDCLVYPRPAARGGGSIRRRWSDRLHRCAPRRSRRARARGPGRHAPMRRLTSCAGPVRVRTRPLRR